MSSYHDFLHTKSQMGPMDGFDPVWIPDQMFGFQRHLADWAIRRARLQMH